MQAKATKPSSANFYVDGVSDVLELIEEFNDASNKQGFGSRSLSSPSLNLMRGGFQTKQDMLDRGRQRVPVRGRERRPMMGSIMEDNHSLSAHSMSGTASGVTSDARSDNDARTSNATSDSGADNEIESNAPNLIPRRLAKLLTQDEKSLMLQGNFYMKFNFLLQAALAHNRILI